MRYDDNPWADYTGPSEYYSLLNRLLDWFERLFR